MFGNVIFTLFREHFNIQTLIVELSGTVRDSAPLQFGECKTERYLIDINYIGKNRSKSLILGQKSLFLGQKALF